MIKLLVVADLSVRGVTVNRLDSLERLNENGHNISSRVRNKYPKSWDIAWCDCVYFLRAANADDLNFIKECKLVGKKIWLDTDDDMLSIPLDHSGYFFCQDPNLRSAYKEVHNLADHVTFSTKSLIDSISVKEHSVVPCSYPDEVLDRYLKPLPMAKTIIWRGTETHEKSLDEFGPAIVEVLRNHTDWRIEFFGIKPWRILGKITNAYYVHPFYDVVDLLQKIHDTRASVHIAPRTDDAFTKSRSSVSYVEAACAGAITVAPNWEEWKLPGILNYTDDFAAKFEQAITEAGTKQYQKRWNASVNYIKKHRTWSATNKQHAEILKKIMNLDSRSERQHRDVQLEQRYLRSRSEETEVAPSSLDPNPSDASEL